jgi:hypothetical protein
MIFMIMTDAGLEAILKDKFKLGAGAGVSVAAMGANIEASTTSAAGADIIAFAHSGGAFGGGAFEGTVIEPRPDWNEALYGAGAASRGILFDRRYSAPHSATALYHSLTVNTGAPVPGAAVAPVASSPAAAPDLPPVTVDPVPRNTRGPLLLAPVETAPLDAPRQTQ